LDRVTIREYKSPFRYTEPRVIELEPTPYLWQASLAEIRRANLPAVVPFLFVLNGVVLKEKDLPGIYLSPTDVVIAVPDPGDDDVLPMVVGLLFAVAAVAISGGALGPAGLGLFGDAFIAGGMGAIVTSMAVSIMGGIVTSMLTKPPDTPTMDAMQGYNTSQAYSWNPQTTQQQGGAIPRPYGCNKPFGNVVNWNIETVNDKQYLNVLLCLGEGPVSRLYNYKLNDQPLENYRGVEIHARLGYLDQTPIPNFNDTKIEIGPLSPTKIVYGSPVTFTTTGDNFNGVEMDVTFSQGLGYANDLGGLDALSVNLGVEIKKQGTATWRPITQRVVTTTSTIYDGKWSLGQWLGGDYPYWYEVEAGSTVPTDHWDGQQQYWYDPVYEYMPMFWRWISQEHVQTVSTTVNYVTITGAQSTAIRKTFRVNGLEAGKYDIRFTNLSPDQTSSRYMDDCYLTAVREIYEDDFEYPRMIMVGIRALATDQLSGSLRFSCYCDGALVRVTLDGSAWSTAFSRSPAWVGYDILTRPILDNDLNVVRYDGALPDKVDVDAHLDLAEYDATLVPDGLGSTEELCLFDGTFDSGTTVWDALLKVYRTGRAVPYYAGTKITLSINKPAAIPEAGFLVGMGNVLKDSFQEHWSSVEDRPTELTVEVLNGDNDFAREPLQVINPNLTSYQPPLSMDMFGVIRPSQAWRDGRLRLNANQLLTNTVSVSLPISAIESRIGEVVNISHDVPQWGYSGRLVGISGTDTVILDREVVMTAGKTYGMIIWLKADTRVYRQVLTVTAGTIVKFTAAFDAGFEPQKYDNYSFGEMGIETKPFRILSIQPDMERRFKLACLEYNATLWNSDLEQPVLPTPDYSALEPLPRVTSLALQDRLTKRIDGTIDEVIEISFTRPSSFFYDHAEIWYAKDGAGFVFAGTTRRDFYELPCVALSQYTIAVVTVNTIGNRTSPVDAPQASIKPLGKTARPANVLEFWASPAQGGVRFDWAAIADVDIDYYLLRYHPDPAGTWPNSIDVAKIYSTSITLPAAKSGRYLLKAIDTSGNESALAISVITDIPTILAWNVQEELIEEPAFAGTKTNMAVVGDKLILESQGTIDALADLDAVAHFDTLDEDFWADGYYETPEVDLGSVQTARCSSIVEFIAVDSEHLVDDIQNFDAVSDLDGDLSGVGIQTQIALSQNGTDWGEWQNFMIGDYTFQKAKMRVHAYTNQPKQYTEISKIRFIVDMPDRSERAQDVAVPDTGLEVTFALAYMAKPLVRTTIQSAQDGDYCDVSGVSTTGFTVVVKNAGSGVARTIDWESKGY